MNKKILVLFCLLSLVSCKNGKTSSLISSSSSKVNSFSSSSLVSSSSFISSSEIKKEFFNVTYLGIEGETLFVDKVEKGGSSIFEGEEVIKEDDDKYHYEFSGWNQSLNNVQDNLICSPLFFNVGYDEIDDGDFTYREIFNDTDDLIGYELYKYNNFDDVIELEVPSSFNSFDILMIGEACFMETPLSKIVLSEGIEIIDDYAFNSMPCLKEVVIPDSCYMMKSACFYLTSEIEVIDINKLQFIGSDNFHLCYKLREFTSRNNDFYDTYEGGLYYKGFGALLKVAENVDSVNIHKDCKVLKSESVSRLNNVDKVLISNEDIKLEEAVFFESKFKEVVIESEIRELPKAAFKYCRNLESINLPMSLEVISDYAFYRNESLTSINFPESLYKIGEFSFAYCFSLESFYVPSSLEFIGYGALDEQPSLNRFEVNEENNFYKEIDGLLFSKDASKLIRVPQTRVQISFASDLKVIGSGALYKCDKIEILELNDGLEEIEDFAFYFMSNVHEVVIPNSVSKIGESAFDSMEGLIRIVFPESLKELKKNILTYCTSLVEVVLPKDVEVIGEKAFFYCESLTSFNLPKSIKKMEYQSFENCFALSCIYYEGSKEEYIKVDKKEAGILPSVEIVYLNK